MGMRFYSETSLPMDERLFSLVGNLIHERLGMFFDNGARELLADKLSPLAVARGFGSFLDYYYLLKYDDNAADEWIKVIEALSVQETFFWREMDQVQAVVEEVVPQCRDLSAGETIRIWSAACATGEEPLSIAMALNEAGWFEKAHIEIYASDISPEALAKARSGRYRERSFRNLPPHLREKYFTQHDNYCQVDPELHRRIKWRQINLTDASETAPLAGAQIIFCRNVFIYFSRTAIRQTVEWFFRRMPSPGYLCVGASESLLKLSNDFVLEEISGAFIYVKP